MGTQPSRQFRTFASVILILSFGLVAGCVSTSPPYEEFTLAKVSLDAARAVESARYSPGHWHNAEESFRRGKQNFEDREYSMAREAFIRARMYAERAENLARVTRFKEGEAF